MENAEEKIGSAIADQVSINQRAWDAVNIATAASNSVKELQHDSKALSGAIKAQRGAVRKLVADSNAEIAQKIEILLAEHRNLRAEVSDGGSDRG